MQRSPKPTFYGLLYIDKSQTRYANLRRTHDPLNVYLRCASLCAISIAHHGYDFRLVTNERLRVRNHLENLGIALPDILEHEFTLNVPPGVPFRNAHFKLEFYSVLGSGQFGEHVGVVDIDSVMVAPIDFPLLPPGTLLAYDISDQITHEQGHDKVCADIERVSGKYPAECRWFGGEFLFGHKETFRELGTLIFQLWPNYLESINQLRHVGDEMLVAAALSQGNLKVQDAGQLGFIVRWWTARTYFKQMPFAAAARRSILHLPSDKEFLARAAGTQYRPDAFIRRFRREAAGKLFRRRLFNAMEGLAGRRPKYVATL